MYFVLVAGLYYASTEHLFPQARNYIQSLSYMPKMNFENVFIGANPLGKELLRCYALLEAAALEGLGTH